MSGTARQRGPAAARDALAGAESAATAAAHRAAAPAAPSGEAGASAAPPHAPAVGPRPESRPALPRGVRIARDEVRGQWVLLAPERALRLDDTGLAVLREVDGRRTVAEIAARLAERYGAPQEVVLKDATVFLAGLWARRIVELAEDA